MQGFDLKMGEMSELDISFGGKGCASRFWSIFPPLDFI
jgi:hypothetical protein